MVVKMSIQVTNSRPKRNRITFKVYYTVEVKNSDGKVLKRIRRISHSFTQGFGGAIEWWFTGNPQISISKASPSSGGVNYGMSNQWCMGYFVGGGSGDDTTGIQVGSGTAKTTISDTSLGSVILNGTSSGQLEYGSTSVFAPTINTSTNQATMQISRSFTNNSGANITVSEVGLVLNTPNNTPFLALHDLLPSPITVGNGQVLTVTYQFVVST
jgi:hypothetical protein